MKKHALPIDDAPELPQNRTPMACGEQPGSEIGNSPKRRVLIVDDDPMILRLVSHHLKKTEYEVLVASDGEEAMRVILAERPSVVISDWAMPGMTGIDLVKTIRQTEEIPFIYLIILTANTEKERIVEALNEGANDFLGKPFDQEVLVARVNAGMRMVALEADLTSKTREIYKTHSELRRAHVQTQQIIESIPSALITVNAKGRVTEWNRVAEQILGIPCTDAWGRPFDELEIPWDRAVIIRRLSECRTTMEPACIDEVQFKHRDGTDRVLSVTVTPVHTYDDDVEDTVLIVAADITDRKKAERTLVNSAEQQMALNLLQQDLLGLGDLPEKLTKITDATVRLFDVDFCRIWVTSPGDLCEHGCIHVGVTDGPHVCRYRDKCLHLLASSGRYTHIDGEGHRRVPFGCYKIGRVASGKDHKFLTNEAAIDPRVHNHDWVKELGLVAFAGYQLCPPDRVGIGVLALFSRHIITPEEDAMLESMANTATQVIQRSQNEEGQRSLQIQLVQAQRLESVGQLAAGIAHEINTPTQFVSDNTRFLKNAFPKLQDILARYRMLLDASKAGPAPAEMLDELEAAITKNKLDYLLQQVPEALTDSLEGLERVTTIVRAMKDFSHPGQQGMCAADLNKAVESTTTVARNEWKYVADMVLDLDPSLPTVQCMLGDFNQVILNIVVNAAHAIENSGRVKGTITVTTRQDDTHAEIRISDTGTGIPKEHSHKIFDHFFTTKQVGKGTGQGLAIARQIIVEKHGGSLTFETEMGKGTTFIIRLPIKRECNAIEEMPEHEEACSPG